MFGRFVRWLANVMYPAPAALIAPASDPGRPASFFTTEMDSEPRPRSMVLERVVAAAMPVQAKNMRVHTFDSKTGREVAVGDSSGSLGDSAKAAFALANGTVPDAQLYWYASQSFIGFQLCAILAQHWLVQKACVIPARDAIRNGYKITANDGTEIAPELLTKLAEADKKHGINRQCVELAKMQRVFGIRIALFRVESTDPDYYTNPFNPDGITPGSYRGIVQVDPYWCIPELSMSGAANPAAQGFYEPLYWTIQGVRYHRSHLVICRGPEVPDILKPSYFYAGISLTQQIYERVYAAERTANEGPQLALSKRSMIFYTDTGAALANEEKFTEKLGIWARFRDNFGVKVADKEGDKIEQHDTTLADFDATVMTQYQLVAAIANVPATKLLGTTPKGFNATGEYEEASYHEELESIQTSDMEPMINRHHICVIRSELAPAAGVAPFAVSIEWEALDALTKKEEAEVQKLKAEAGKFLTESGAIDGQDERARIIADPKSGYSGLAPAVPQDATPHLPGPPGTTAMDASDFDPVTGCYADAVLITNQDYIDDAIVAAKIVAGDFLVQLSPEFVTAAGQRYRVIIDGHHSLEAAVRSGNTPVFVESNYAGSDYVNALTKLPAFGTPADA